MPEPAPEWLHFLIQRDLLSKRGATFPRIKLEMGTSVIWLLLHRAQSPTFKTSVMKINVMLLHRTSDLCQIMHTS